jgi:hypothetical protein
MKDLHTITLTTEQIELIVPILEAEQTALSECEMHSDESIKNAYDLIEDVINEMDKDFR